MVRFVAVDQHAVDAKKTSVPVESCFIGPRRGVGAQHHGRQTQTKSRWAARKAQARYPGKSPDKRIGKPRPEQSALLGAENKRQKPQAKTAWQREVPKICLCPLPVLPQVGPQQHSGDHGQWIFFYALKNHRREQRIKKSAEEAADGDPKIELSQMFYPGPVLRQFTMAHQ